MSFNLTQQPWIPVVGQDWQRQDISLIELFQNWQELREILADNPPTTFAIYRLLIAIIHRAYNGPEDTEHWEEICSDNGKRAIKYLQEQTEHFDLMHPDYPFFQDKTIAQEQSAEIYQAHSLHGNNTSTVFCHDHQWSGSSLSQAEAARLLLRLHLFDVGGRKTGSSVSAGVIPTMDAANFLPKGKTLQQTILLNLIKYDGVESPCEVKGEDLPAWERQSQPAKERAPAGYIDYLTFPWRRVRLFFEGDRAVNVAFHAGDSLPKTLSPSQWECSIAYNKTKKGLSPVRLNLSRSLWRDSAAFLQSSDGSERPKLLGWLAELSDEDLIDDRLNLQVLGLAVDKTNIAKLLGWMSDQISVPVIYLKEKALWQSLGRALQVAEEHQQIFRSFKGSPYHALAEVLKYHDASNLAKSLNGETSYWVTLDYEFQTLLATLPNEKNDRPLRYGDQALTHWRKTVQKAAKDSFTSSIESIRNYEARAAALRSLDYYLAKLRGDIKERKEKKSSKKSELITG